MIGCNSISNQSETASVEKSTATIDNKPRGSDPGRNKFAMLIKSKPIVDNEAKVFIFVNTVYHCITEKNLVEGLTRALQVHYFSLPCVDEELVRLTIISYLSDSFFWQFWTRQELELAETMIAVSSAKSFAVPDERQLLISFIYKEKRRGPRTEPWATPVFISL